MPIHPDQYIADFAGYLQFEKRYSAATNRAYGDDLKAFFAYLQSDYTGTDLLTVSPFMVRSWLSSLKEGPQPLESRTIARKLSSLRSFYKYLLKKQLLTISPVAGLTAPKAGKKLPVYVEENQAIAMLEIAGAGEGWKSITTGLIVPLFYETGMRLSELVNLKKSQVDYYTKTIRLLGKGNKERVVPMNPVLLEALKKYESLKAEQDWKQYDKEMLFLTEKGKALYAKYVYRLVNEVLKRNETTAHLSKKSPHILRHSFATHLLNEGAELNAVKELLGHASLAATQVYTHNTIGKLKEVHKKAHPRG